MDEKYAELRDRILNPNDFVLFDEVIATMESGHYRSSYIMAWINIIESLKNKLYQLAALEDIRAKEAITDIEKLERDGMSTDRKIFEQCTICEIILPTQSNTIEYLWRQRCIFAHPYNTHPTIEQLDFIIDQAVNIILSQEVDFNKNYIDEFCRNLILKPHLVDNDENKILELANNTLVRIKDRLHPYYFKTLFYQYGKNKDKPNEIRKIELLVKNLISQTSFSLDDSNWRFEKKAIDFPLEFSLCVVDENFWNTADNRVKDILMNYFSTLEDKEILLQLSSIYQNLQSLNILDEDYKAKYFSKLDSLTFLNSIYYYGNSEKQYERIIEELVSWQFTQQDNVVKFINNDSGLRTVNSFGSEESIYLGRVLYASADQGHWKSQSLINLNNFESSPLSKEIFMGIILGHFISLKDEPRFDREKSYLAMKTLNILDETLIQQFYDIIFNILDHNKAKHEHDIWTFGTNTLTNFQTAVENLNLDWNPVNLENYNLLEEKVVRYFELD